MIAYDDASTHDQSTVQITPNPIQQGSISDFKNVQLDPEQKSATPFYVNVSVKNIGKGDLSGDSPANYLDGVDDRGQAQNSVIFFGDFPRCESVTPKSLKPGQTYKTCETFLIPKGGSLVGMRWVVFDEKTGKSDLNRSSRARPRTPRTPLAAACPLPPGCQRDRAVQHLDAVARPRRPVPRLGSAPPLPSSSTSTTSRPSVCAMLTAAPDASE